MTATCAVCGAEIRLTTLGWGHVAPQSLRNGKRPHRAVPARVGAAA